MANKNFQILEIDTFQPHSVKFISKTVKDRGNPSTYHETSQQSPFNNKKSTSKLDEK